MLRLTIDPYKLGLRRHKSQFGDRLEISHVEHLDAADVVDLHRRRNLQIEYVAAGYRPLVQQFDPRIHALRRNGQYVKKEHQIGQCVERVARGAPPSQTVEVDRGRVGFAEDPRSYVERRGSVPRSPINARAAACSGASASRA